MSSFINALRRPKWGRILPWVLAASVLISLSLGTDAQAATADPNAPKLTFLSWLGDNTAGALILGVAWLYQQLGIILLTAGAYLLDLSIRVSLGIGDISFLTGGSLFLSEGVKQGWSVLRDIANIGFIFALIYIAARTILGLTSGSLGKQVVAVIIGAMFINFSAFLALVVIDTGNGLAVVAYNQITRSGSPQGPTVQDSGLISGAFLQYLNPQALLSQKPGDSNTNAAIVALLSGTLYLFAAYVLLEASFVFIIRTVRLLFSIIVAPLMFVSYAIPGLEGNLKKWFRELLDYSMVAPAYIFSLLFMLLLLKNFTIGSTATGIASVGNLGALADGKDFSVVKMIFLYILIIVLMNRCLAFARGVSKQISDTATSWAGTTLGLAMGGVAGVGRMTLGRGASKFASTQWLKDRGANSKIGAGALRLTKATAKGSFDVRGTSPLKGAAKQLHTDFGKGGGKGGYEKILEEQVKERASFAKDYLGEDKNATKKKEEEIKARREAIEKKEIDAGREKRAAEEALRKVARDREDLRLAGTLDATREAELVKREDAARAEVEKHSNAVSAAKIAKDQFDKSKKEHDAEKKEAGYDRQKAYADRLDLKKGENKKIYNPLTWVVARKDKEGADKIRKTFKEDKNKTLQDAIKQLFPDEAGAKKEENKKEGGGANDNTKEGEKKEAGGH